VTLHLKRAYDPPAASDGYRVLIDRLWPRGVSKERARLDEWARELAPSSELRRWFGHDPRRWQEFVDKYRAELARQPGVLRSLGDLRRRGRITLLFGASDVRYNHAVVLREVLEGTSRLPHAKS